MYASGSAAVSLSDSASVSRCASSRAGAMPGHTRPMPKFAHTVEVSAPPAEVFAILDDVRRTPEWLKRCTGIDKLDDGSNTAGTRLKYHYKSANRDGTMDGRITVHEPDEHVAMLYTDPMMDVEVDFVARP